MNIKKFSLSVLLFSICLLLSGCASLLHIPEEGKFTAVGNYPEMKVT
jgi:uncharacterized protein YceK